MSQTSGAGGSAAPGWYTDPHDPSQLRWWSGQGWTEHVSAGAGAPQAVQPAEAQAVPAQPEIPQPLAAQPMAAQPVAAQPIAAQPVAAQQPDALPSRRALRDPATEASEAAEAALQAQQAAQQAQYGTQQPAQVQQPVQPVQPPQPQVQLTQPSAPVPTLPVQPRSFLEQAGYPPLDGSPASPATPADQNAWNQPAAAAPAAWPAQQAAPAAAVQPQAPQPAQPNAWSQPSAPVQAPVQNQWNQPVAPVAAPLPPVQQTWGAPGTTPPTGSPDGIDSLFGGAPADAAAAASPAYGADQSAWGLSPTGQEAAPSGSRRRGAESAAPESSGSSTFWAWLIAISPILAAGSIGYVIASTGFVTTGWPVEAAIAAPYLLVLLFALADRAGLVNLGHSEPRSPGWALLSAPVYLIVRAGETRREDGSGTALTLIWFFSFLIAIAGFVGYGILTHHAFFTGLPTTL